MSDEWGPWIEWGCIRLSAEPVGTFVHAVHDYPLSDEYVGPVIYSGEDAWSLIIRYRIRKPRAMKLLQEIVKNPERELEDA